MRLLDHLSRSERVAPGYLDATTPPLGRTGRTWGRGTGRDRADHPWGTRRRGRRAAAGTGRSGAPPRGADQGTAEELPPRPASAIRPVLGSPSKADDARRGATAPPRTRLRSRRSATADGMPASASIRWSGAFGPNAPQPADPERPAHRQADDAADARLRVDGFGLPARRCASVMLLPARYGKSAVVRCRSTPIACAERSSPRVAAASHVGSRSDSSRRARPGIRTSSSPKARREQPGRSTDAQAQRPQHGVDRQRVPAGHRPRRCARCRR